MATLRTEFLRVRVSPSEKEAIDRAAQMEGVDVSVLMRGAVRKEVIRIFTAAGESNPFQLTAKKPAKKQI